MSSIDPPAGSRAGSKRGGSARAGADQSSIVEVKDISTPATAARYLNSLTDLEKARALTRESFKLDRMDALFGALENPQNSVKCVHIAGSKGKGSVAEMLDACLSSCGCTVGRFSSPHLVDVRERVRIDGQLIGPTDFVRLTKLIAEAALTLPKKVGPISYFEAMTAIAMCHFADRAVDLAVVEVGLGGRLDSTNLVMPLVSVVTEIQLEHTEVLGDTLEKIAAEKAGIFKPGVPVISVPQTEGVDGVLRAEAERVGSPIRVLGAELDYSERFEADAEHGPHARISLTTSRTEYEHLAVPLKGHHQAKNCGAVLGVLDALRELGVIEASELDVAEGLESVGGEGKLELVYESPRVMVDGAHTADSIRATIEAAGAHLSFDSMVAVFGCAADKDLDALLTELARGADKIIFTKASNNPRAVEPKALQKRFAELSPKMTQTEPSVKEAINTAARAVGRDDLILAIGSFMIAGEAKKLLRDAAAKKSAGRS